jgi:cell division protein FtsA
MTRESKNLFVGLDIGTSKIVAIVGQLEGERLEVIGLGQAQSDGLKKGVVVNIEATVASIQKALEEAELMADCKIASVWTGIAGSHIRSFNSSGMVAIKEKEVSQADMDRVIETATAVSIPADQQVLHVLPQEYIIDGQEDVREPLGMSGVRLEVRVHIVTGAVSAAQNIIKCIRRCGLEVEELILQPLASSHAVLTEDERELGVALVDIGGGTTDIAIFAGAPFATPPSFPSLATRSPMTLRWPFAHQQEMPRRSSVVMASQSRPLLTHRPDSRCPGSVIVGLECSLSSHLPR